MSKLCLLLPNISHAGIDNRGNIPHIAKDLGYICIAHDWHKKYFHEEDELAEIEKVIKKYDHVVIISCSFGDLIARKLLKSHHTNIDAHISVCGFGSKKYLTFSSKLLLYIGSYLWKFFYKNKKLVKRIAKKFKRPLSPYALKHAHKRNTQSAIQGLKKGLGERTSYALSYQETPGKISVPGYILFSGNDNNFSPSANAHYIGDMYEKVTILYLYDAGHGSFLEMPEKYDPIIGNLLSTIDGDFIRE